MKFIAVLGTILILAGCLYLVIRIRFPRPRKEPPPVIPVTSEMLKNNWWNFLIGLGAWLTAIPAGGSLVLFGILQLPVSFTPLAVGWRILPWSLVGAGIVVLLAGRVWYSVALFRMLLGLWRGFTGEAAGGAGGRSSSRCAMIPALGGIFVVATWLKWQAKTPGSRRSRLVLGGTGLLLWGGAMAAPVLTWWLWIVFYGWMTGVFFLLSQAAVRLRSGADDASLPFFPAAVRRQHRKPLTLLAAVLVLTFGSWAALWIYIAQSEARAEARLRDCGVPTTPEGMHTLFPMPENNAYSLYLELDAERKKHSGLPLKSFESFGAAELYRMPSLPPEMEADLEDWLNDREPLAKLLDRLNPTQPMQFPRLWENTPDMQAPECSTVRTLALYDCLRFVRALHAGDAAEMQKLWRQLQTLREWIRDDGIVISNLVSIAIGDMQFLSLEAMLNAVSLSDAELRALMLQLRNDEKAQYADWRLSIVGEAFFYQYLLQSPQMREFFRKMNRAYHRNDVFSRLAQQICTDPLVSIWLIPWNRAFGMNYFAGLVTQADQDYYRIEKLIQADEAELQPLPISQVFSRMLLPALGRTGQVNAQEVARLRIMRTAIAAELYRRKHGSWPEHLAALVPEFLDAVPVDPFDGQPLRCRQGKLETFEFGLKPGETASATPPPDPNFEADETVVIPQFQPIPAAKFIRGYRPITRSGFRIYSVGRDKTDDGGRSRSNEYPNTTIQNLDRLSQRRPPGDDISFTLYDSSLEESR